MTLPLSAAKAMSETEDSVPVSCRTELEEVVAGFNASFKFGQIWPSRSSLQRFLELVRVAYVELGNKSANNTKFWNMVMTVDKRWQALHVCAAVERMVTRAVSEVPVGPRRRLFDFITERGHDPLQNQLFQLLGEVDVTRSRGQWSLFTSDLDKLLSADTQRVLRAIPSSIVHAPDAFAWLKFMDVHRQVFAWRLAYEADFNVFAQWVYAFRNDKLIALLEKIAWQDGSLPSAEEWQSHHKKVVNRTRQRKFRGKDKSDC